MRIPYLVIGTSPTSGIDGQVYLHERIKLHGMKVLDLTMEPYCAIRYPTKKLALEDIEKAQATFPYLTFEVVKGDIISYPTAKEK